MPAKDSIHDAVKNALIKEGWTITDDPLRVVWQIKDAFIDLGAQRFVGAEREERKVAVEVKSFTGLSEINNLAQALGQYLLYESMLKRREPERTLYLAIDRQTYRKTFEQSIGSIVLQDYSVKLIVCDVKKEEVIRWLP